MRKLLCLLVITSALGTATEPTTGARISFTKSFPGSTPAWEQVTVDTTGAGSYQEDPKDEDPIKFHLADNEKNEVFDLAQKLGYLSRPLEANLKVASMGMKTLRYEGDGRTGEVRFNYTEDLDGKALIEWFERIADTERGLIALEAAVRFDKLGVHDAILRIEVIRDQKRLVNPEQFLPMLDRVAKNDSYLHIARERAANLADSIRALPK